MLPTFTARTSFLPPQPQQSAAESALASLGALTSLAERAGGSPALSERILHANTAAEAFAHAEAEGVALGDEVARAGWDTAAAVLAGSLIAGEPVDIEITVFDRDGRLVGHAPFRAAHTAPPRKRCR